MSEATRAENVAPKPYDLEAHYQELEQKITAAGIPADLGRVRAAFECADRAHSGQKRRDGSPYVSHCIAAAIITAEMGLDEDSIIAALLHDTIEDTSLTHEDIARSFGTSVADIVEGVTKLTRVQYTSVEEQQMENMRKMLLAMAKDIRVILIKMADRLHNMRTMAYQSEEKQRIKSLETMEIYAPIAHRLGLQKEKWELEDLSLKYLDPDGYREIITYLDSKADVLNKFMSDVKKKITDRLTEYSIHATVQSRIKHTYSIYRKMYTQKRGLDEIFDLCAFRVIVDDREDTGALAKDALSEATVKIHVGEGRFVATGESAGPVGALDAALRMAIVASYPQVEAMELIDYKVRLLDESQGTDAITRVTITATDGVDTWGTVGVSENVIEASWNALVDSLEYGLFRARVRA